MNSLVLSTVTRLLSPLLLVFSVFVLLRGTMSLAVALSVAY